jgi:hypothetical protein
MLGVEYSINNIHNYDDTNKRKFERNFWSN